MGNGMAMNERDERRAAALRANLRRRKGQARESAAAATSDAADPAPDLPPGQPRENDPAA
jgi:hypothetical protein